MQNLGSWRSSTHSIRFTMNKPYQSEIEKFQRELNRYRSLATANRGRLEANSLLGKQLTFWAESTRFLISEPEIWGRMRDASKWDETAYKVLQALDRLRDVLDQLPE